jgi:hypothetical protein
VKNTNKRKNAQVTSTENPKRESGRTEFMQEFTGQAVEKAVIGEK